ncbi:hypothetical protein AVEN_95699-1 [Araneus ventricosus]|uniref:Uncharacterized protein n=2 Tax=Araneus ventricosus TaxID=182803 RepID=A0A4Y2UJE5_ARAVE|nr:hypothetical protein AVEN_95699-1 [Araneus ventricosus]
MSSQRLRSMKSSRRPMEMFLTGNITKESHQLVKSFRRFFYAYKSTSKVTRDALAKAGADDASVPSAPLTYLELFSIAKGRNKTIWLIPLVHHWYQGS